LSEMQTVSSVHEVSTGGGKVQVTLSERGEGRPVLVLHGGGGPQTVTRFADLLAVERPARVITPIHPGFAGTPRPEWLDSTRGLGAVYSGLLVEMDLTDVTVVGNSIGGWVAAEMALLDTTRISSFILADAVGIEVAGHPIVDFFSLNPRQIAEHSYYEPDKYGIDPSTLSPDALTAMAGNRAALTVYGGATMNDPTLAARLAGVRTPTLVIWGDSDRIAAPDYGRALAGSIPGADFKLLPKTGHMPQLETPEQLIDAVWSFAGEHARATRG
jgi:pimeloyl-ACP methyl ester carboxylesterase